MKLRYADNYFIRPTGLLKRVKGCVYRHSQPPVPPFRPIGTVNASHRSSVK